MFGMRDEKYGRVDSIIGSQAEVKGDIKSKDTIRIDGKIEGNISVDGDVVLGRESVINGDIAAKNIIIGGKITGNILAGEKVEVIDGGQVMGNIKSPSVTIAEGGIFEGHCEMTGRAKDEIHEIPEKESKKNQV